MASLNKDTLKNYNTFETEMNKILEETIGCTKIRIGNKIRIPMNNEQKAVKKSVKDLRKSFKIAIKDNSERKAEILEQLIESHKKLRNEISNIKQN